MQLVVRLKEADKQKSVDDVTSNLSQLDLQRERFVPWQSRIMDRLIMKLDLLAGGRDVHHDHGSLDGLKENLSGQGDETNKDRGVRVRQGA